MNDHQILVIIPAPCGVAEETLRTMVERAVVNAVKEAQSLAPGSSLAQVDPSVIQVVHSKAESYVG